MSLSHEDHTSNTSLFPSPYQFRGLEFSLASFVDAVTCSVILMRLQAGRCKKSVYVRRKHATWKVQLRMLGVRKSSKTVELNVTSCICMAKCMNVSLVLEFCDYKAKTEMFTPFLWSMAGDETNSTFIVFVL